MNNIFSRIKSLTVDRHLYFRMDLTSEVSNRESKILLEMKNVTYLTPFVLALKSQFNFVMD